MKTYQIYFIGRLKGSIGINYEHVKTVKADNENAACLKLYDTHEHISVTQIKELKDYPR